MANSLDMLEVKQVLIDLVVVLSSDKKSELYEAFCTYQRIDKTYVK